MSRRFSEDYARDGFCVMRGVLDKHTIKALQRDADRRAAGLDLEVDGTVWVHDTCHLSLHDHARTHAKAYLALRARGQPNYWE